MSAREAEDSVQVTVAGFVVGSCGFDEGELREAVNEICDRIGSALSSLGTYCTHGTVELRVGEITVSSE